MTTFGGEGSVQAPIYAQQQDPCKPVRYSGLAYLDGSKDERDSCYSFVRRVTSFGEFDATEEFGLCRIVFQVV